MSLAKKISVIIPTHNSREYILETLQSINAQILPQNVSLEVSIYDDGSNDGTLNTCQEILSNKLSWQHEYKICGGPIAQGAGYARNQAIKNSTGEFLMWNDSDDLSAPTRALTQLNAWLAGEHRHETLVGARFVRFPAGSTRHYAETINSLSPKDLVLKSYRELSLIQPTWFMSRQFFDSLGGYKEGMLAEDLELFHRILDVPNVSLLLADLTEPLVTYRYVLGSVSSKTPAKLLTSIKLRAFERRVLSKWGKFSIWGAGRDGKAFFRELGEPFKDRVINFCDIDPKKIERGFNSGNYHLPVVHQTQVVPPFVVCVAMGRTDGELERNIASLNLVEGIDYYHFF